MAWLFGALIFFAALFPVSGLMKQGTTHVETYASASNLQNGHEVARLFGKSLIVSVEAATFQRSTEYAPAYFWGQFLAVLEVMLTSSVFVLFLFALRRQYKR